MTPDLATFRALFPELSGTPDATVTLWLTDSTDFLLQSSWGKCWPKAVLYLSAHQIAVANARAASAAGGIVPQSGVLQSGSEEGISFTFFDKGTTDRGAWAQWLATTPYGDAYAALQRACITRGMLSW